MNLPPVPPPPPPPPPPAPDALPPPPPPPGSEARALSLSPKARWGFALAAGVIIVLAIIKGLIDPPSEAKLRAFVESELAQDGIKVLNVSYQGQREPASDQAFRQKVDIVAESGGGSRYEEVSVASGTDFGVAGDVLGGVPGGVAPPPDAELAIDFGDWKPCRALLSGAEAPRLASLAGLSAEETELIKATVVRELPHDRDVPGLFSGWITGERRGLTWRLGFKRESNAESRTGTLESFKGRVLVLNRPADRTTVLDLGRRLPGLRARLEKGVAALLAEKKSAALALLKPGALFAGTVPLAPAGERRTARLYLEVTEVRGDENPPRLSALLRNDGSWRDKRVFAGELAYAADSGALQLQLSSPTSDSEEDAGPFLDNNFPGDDVNIDDDEAQLTLEVGTGGLSCRKNGAMRWRLEPVRAEARAAIMAEAAGEAPALLAATQPGTAYAGTIINRVEGTKENFLLRFTKLENEGRHLEAVLLQPERASWKCSLQGQVETNRYRAKGDPIELNKTFSREFSPPPEMTAAFESEEEEGATFKLHLDGGKLVGENRRFVFRFERTTAK